MQTLTTLNSNKNLPQYLNKNAIDFKDIPSDVTSILPSKLLTVKEKFLGGIHKGLTIAEVLDKEPDYLIFLQKRFKNVILNYHAQSRLNKITGNDDVKPITYNPYEKPNTIGVRTINKQLSVSTLDVLNSIGLSSDLFSKPEVNLDVDIDIEEIKPVQHDYNMNQMLDVIKYQIKTFNLSVSDVVSLFDINDVRMFLKEEINKLISI